MNQRELDRAIIAVREEGPDEKVVRDAAGRVFRNVFDAAFLGDPVARIRGCSDFQALIPDYLSRALTPARVLLLEDHTRQCVSCRHAVQQARGHEPSVSALRGNVTADSGRRGVPVMAWAMAALLVLGIAIGIAGGRYGLLPGQHAVRATVLSVEGRLYRISDLGSSLVKAGAAIENADELRTASGSNAVLRLTGGDEVEVAERSDVSVSRGWRGTTVNLEQGRLIVKAVDGRSGRLSVLSGGVLVPVWNALLSVDHGVKGSRVAVARGSAQVEQGQNRFKLTAGQQMATNGLSDVPVSSEFAWSKNANSYLPLLAEFSTLQKQFRSIPSPGLRYSTNLAKYVPEDTALYAAIPNLGGTLREAKQIFDERLAQSAVLQDWWNQQHGSHSADFDRMINQISSVSQYLGDEILFSVARNRAHTYREPVLLAEIRQPGLPEYIRQNLPPSSGVQVMTEVAAIPAGPAGRLLLLVSNNVLAASTDPLQLKAMARLIQAPSSGHFTSTPFYSQIAESYQTGAGYIFAADLEQMFPKSVNNSEKQVLAGADNARYLVLERRDASGATDTRASLSFDGARQGMASWLSAPGPMGSLNFVSPEASVAASFVMKSPRTIVEELMAFASPNNSGFAQDLKEFESGTGVNVVNDVAAPFGRDATFAVDGPLLPVPSWKLVIEVNDPLRLQQTLTALIDRFNQHGTTAADKVQLGSEQVNSRTFYWLRGDKMPNFRAYYTFVDGYLLAGPSEANLIQALQNRQTGYTLLSSAIFRNQLPSDTYTNSSAIIYTNPGSALGPLAQQLKGTASLNASQQQFLSTLLTNIGPGLICVYGGPDRITAASRGSFLGFNLGTLAGIRQGQPLLPLIAASTRSVKAIQ